MQSDLNPHCTDGAFNARLSLLQECADAGWWKGEIGGRQGVFPDNFVKLLDVDKEVILVQGDARQLLETRCVNRFFHVAVFPETKEAASSLCTFG